MLKLFGAQTTSVVLSGYIFANCVEYSVEASKAFMDVVFGSKIGVQIGYDIALGRMPAYSCTDES